MIAIDPCSRTAPAPANAGAAPVAARGTVLDIQRCSIHDGPGIRTTVFFKGCPLSCWWCHNPESQAANREIVARQERCLGCRACEDACPRGAVQFSGGGPAIDRERCTLCGACTNACHAEALEIVGREMGAAEVLSEIEKDVAFFDESGGGVTFSGGEPLSQPGFLLALLHACRAQEIHTAVDTCGFAPWHVLEQVYPYTDLFLFDLKLLDDGHHRTYTGVSNRLILANLHRLAHLGCEIILRLPLVPGVNDADERVRAMGEFAAGLPHVRRVDVLPYHHIAIQKYARLDRAYGLLETRPPSAEWVASRAEILARLGLEVRI
ncbi:MAG TPA: glycyl-radical enzyme activating protein, partial [Anaerolineae bacterium]|nr:glycyl-radical enzyme activating protein [Anaerolineae bacterium]